jgi:superfamily I DNA/RNA helicase
VPSFAHVLVDEYQDLNRADQALPHTAAEDLLEIVMRRYERASTLI